MGNELGSLAAISAKAVAAWEAEFSKAGFKVKPSPERQKEYARLSGFLQAIGLRHNQELPVGAVSLLMRVEEGKVSVEVYDRSGNRIGEIPNDSTSVAFRDELQNTFQHAVSPDHDGVIAIIS